MRMPRVRFTVRWLIIAVAVACCIAFEVRVSLAHRERAAFFARCESMSLQMVGWDESIADYAASKALGTDAALKKVLGEKIEEKYDLSSEKGVEYELLRSGIPQAKKRQREWKIRSLESTLRYWRTVEAKERSRPGFSKFRRIYDYEVAMRRKYERAARYPWLPVAPDPPEPK